MKIPFRTRVWRWFARLVPWVMAAVCFFRVPPSVWADASASLVAALSLMAAAILLRIMRAFPVTDPDGFADKAEIDSLEFAIRRVMKSLAFAVAVAVVAIFLLVFRSMVADLALGVPSVDAYRGNAYSAVLGWAIAFVAVRITYVVRMDFSIISQQATAVRRVFERRRAREVAEARRSKDDLGYDFKDDAPYPGRDEERKH